MEERERLKSIFINRLPQKAVDALTVEHLEIINSLSDKIIEGTLIFEGNTPKTEDEIFCTFAAELLRKINLLKELSVSRQ